jgi:hypothetical protein
MIVSRLTADMTLPKAAILQPTGIINAGSWLEVP